MRRIIGFALLILLISGLIWGLVGIITGFSNPSLISDNIGTFDLAIYVFGICMGFSFYVLRETTIKRNIWIALAAILLNVVLGIVLRENASFIATYISATPLTYYILFFIPQFLTSFAFGFFI